MKLADIRQELEHVGSIRPLEGERYASCLATYEAASDQRERILRWFTDHVAPELSSQHARVLSVGCGAGDLDEGLLAAGAGHAKAVSYVGLEPDPRQCERFVARMGFEDHPDIDVAAHNLRFEEFDEQRRFDLVLMVHSLYYMEDPQRALERGLDLVGEDGLLTILIASNDALNELASSFWSLTNERPTWFSEDLAEHLEESGLDFERKRIEATLDVTACCEPGSARGIRIADFLAQVPTGELPDHLQGMIFAYLEESANRDGARRWLAHDVDAFTIGRGGLPADRALA